MKEREREKAPSAAVASEAGEFLKKSGGRGPPCLPAFTRSLDHSLHPSVHNAVRERAAQRVCPPHRGRYAMVAANSAPRERCEMTTVARDSA